MKARWVRGRLGTESLGLTIWTCGDHTIERHDEGCYPVYWVRGHRELGIGAKWYTLKAAKEAVAWGIKRNNRGGY